MCYELMAIVLLLAAVEALGTEPACVCSKFHYEESLLERMIRSDIKYEEMRQALQGDMRKMNDSFTQLMDDLRAQQADIAKSASTTLDEMEKRLSDVGSLKDLSKTPLVAFSSKEVRDLALDADQVLMFMSNIYNHGQGYDSSTGQFTAPVGGVYMFTAHLCHERIRSVCYSIVVDDVAATKGVFFDRYRNTCSFATTTVYVQALQKVWIKTTCASVLLSDELHSNVFSGVLINNNE